MNRDRRTKPRPTRLRPWSEIRNLPEKTSKGRNGRDQKIRRERGVAGKRQTLSTQGKWKKEGGGLVISHLPLKKSRKRRGDLSKKQRDVRTSSDTRARRKDLRAFRRGKTAANKTPYIYTSFSSVWTERRGLRGTLLKGGKRGRRGNYRADKDVVSEHMGQREGGGRELQPF